MIVLDHLSAKADADIGEHGQAEIEVVQDIGHAAVFLFLAADLLRRAGWAVAFDRVVEVIAFDFCAEAVTETVADAGHASGAGIERVIMIAVDGDCEIRLDDLVLLQVHAGAEADVGTDNRLRYGKRGKQSGGGNQPNSTHNNP